MESLGARYRRFVPLVLAVYVLAVAAAFLYFNMRIKVETVAVILFIAALLSGRGLLFVRDWGVFIVVLLGWQLASGLATDFHFPWHLTEMISADKLMFFGTVPAVWLQQHLYHPGVLEPWDVFSGIMYMLHFLVPLVAGFIIWMANRDLFRKFAVTYVLVALAGFATYIFYPAVPPWLAAKHLIHIAYGQYQVVGIHHGVVYLPGVKNLFDVIAGHWYNPYNGSINIGFLHQVHYDQVGAIPSEHAMYPFLFFLFLRRQFGGIAYLALLYIAGLLFAIMYMGQHYMIDAIIGFLYAGAGYALVMHAWPAIVALVQRRRRVRRVETPLLAMSELEEAGSR
ncbi:MAG: phosphatase PAP2 family protein [Chloroflexota bacterium]